MKKIKNKIKKAETKKSPIIQKKRKSKKKVIVKIIGMNMEEVYSVINMTQLKRTEQEIVIDPVNAPVIENVLKDCKITFKKQNKPDGLYYKLIPPPITPDPEIDFFFNDDLPDEFVEDGFCF